ncbi:MAG: LysM peptidoglycan-binding domain-containing protein, partial [Spirochaetaceae bacterium]|nr:LysM peptidoglycan-binding domain-containing protein [Spirochaetaceae bacterium]
TGSSGGTSGASASSGTVAFTDTYTVKKGDTLWEIARLFSTSATTLAKNNGISTNSVLSVGQKLKVPTRQ